MTNLNLYQPGVVDANINFPSCWNDLSIQELRIVAKSILAAESDPGAANAKLLLGILQERINLETRGDVRQNLKDIKYKLDHEDAIINFWPALEFLFTSNQLTRQPFPVVAIKKTWLRKAIEFIGPESDFNNITAGEFEDTEYYFGEFKTKPGAEPLANLAAILYRPAGIAYMQFDVHQNKIVPFNTKSTVPYFLDLPAEDLYLIFLWYSGCRNNLPLQFPNCFSGGDDTKAEPDPLVFTKCIHAGAGPKNGTRENIRQTLLKEFLFDLEQETIHNKEL